MARGQITYLNLTNGVLRRLGKTQVVSADFAGLAADTWGGLVKSFLNEAQAEVYKEHDWSTLITSGTFTTSSRTYDLSTSFSDFGRVIDLVDTTNERLITAVNQRDIDAYDPGLDDAGAPTAYAINYPDLLFDRTPASVAYRLRYLRRPTTLSAAGDLSILPEFCDLPMIWWTYWQLQATREDAADGGAAAKATYEQSLARAIGQDRRRMDRLFVLQPVFPTWPGRAVVPFPPEYQGY